MQALQNQSFNDLVQQFLGTRLPQELTASIHLPELPSDTQAFIQRMLSLMQSARYSATGFNSAFIRWLANIPNMLPSAWGGRIPPLTLSGRHRKLDAYVIEQNYAVGNDPPVFVDVGCGFPPVTAVDTARVLPDWQIFGIDRSFADYVLYDIDGHYACFDQQGVFLYFQGLTNPGARNLYLDPRATRKRFKKLFGALFPLLKNSDDTTSETVEMDGNRLIHHHIRDFEKHNLTFIQSDATKISLSSVKVIRCMNILVYFEPESRKDMLQQMGAMLAEDGIMITGTNGLGIQTRYSLYRKDGDSLVPSEFAFSLDNLGHISFMPWFTIHANDPEAMLLAQLARTIRSDRNFWIAFSNRLDELLENYEICHRASDGFFQFHQEEMPLSEYMQKDALLWRTIAVDGFLDGMVTVLKQAGYNAWINTVGDIAVQPAAEHFS